ALRSTAEPPGPRAVQADTIQSEGTGATEAGGEARGIAAADGEQDAAHGIAGAAVDAVGELRLEHRVARPEEEARVGGAAIARAPGPRRRVDDEVHGQLALARIVDRDHAAPGL